MPSSDPLTHRQSGPEAFPTTKEGIPTTRGRLGRPWHWVYFLTYYLWGVAGHSIKGKPLPLVPRESPSPFSRDLLPSDLRVLPFLCQGSPSGSFPSFWKLSCGLVISFHLPYSWACLDRLSPSTLDLWLYLWKDAIVGVSSLLVWISLRWNNDFHRLFAPYFHLLLLFLAEPRGYCSYLFF